MRSPISRVHALGLAGCCALCLLVPDCRSNGLNALNGRLAFSSPDQPAAVTTADAGFIQIAFGPVTVDSTRTLTLSYAGVGAAVSLGSLAAVQPDSEFSLPFVTGTVVDPTPKQIPVAFSPTSIGDKSAVFQLTYFNPATEVVTIELTGQGVPQGLTVVPDPVDFGQVEINLFQSLSITITNDRSVPATLVLGPLENAGQGPDGGPFAIGSPSSTALAPGASASMGVTFGPLVSGPASAAFTVAGWPDDAPVTVNLIGTGLVSWLQVTSPVDFGFVPLFTTASRSAVVTNVGSFTTLHLIAPASVTPPFDNGGFALGSPQPAVPVPLAPGQSVSIPLSFIAESLQAYSGSLFLTSDDPGSRNPVAELEGYGGGPRIECFPEVIFGPVPVGMAFSRKELCINAGTAVPGHPELRLEIPQSGLATDKPAFTANLLLPDGGLAGPDYTASLLPGQSAAIDVAFLPRDAGVDLGRLSVASNDTNDADAGAVLVAEGVIPGPCSLEILPSELAFGDVPPGLTGRLQLEVDNTGLDFCEIGHITLDPAANPAFSLPGGDPGPLLLSFPGNTDNPGNLPSSLQILVQFQPATAEAAATGAVDITTLDSLSPAQVVPLTAYSQAGCLIVQPASHDFGLVGFSQPGEQICVPDSATFTAANLCGVPVTIDQIGVDAGSDPGPQFAVDYPLYLPYTLAPGREATLEAHFEPTGVGKKLEDITISTSEAPTAPFLIPLAGDAELTGTRTDTFVVPVPPKDLDLLWVLDEDDDFTQMNAVAAVLPQLIDAMDQQQIDYQIAVTSTDTCDGGSSDLGAFEPCEHCLSKASSDPLFITPQTAGPATTLGELFAVFDLSPQLGLCAELNGDEHFFDSIADALSPGLLGGHNAGFIRDGAYLAIILVNGDAEDDANGDAFGGTVGPYLTSLAQVTAVVQGLKPDADMVSVSYVNSGAGTFNLAQEIGQLVQATGGVELDTSLPAAVWQAMLLNVVSFSNQYGGFPLASVPAVPSQIAVYVNDVLASGWTYDSSSNAIVFNPLAAPGSTITVTYQVGCP